MRLNLGSGETKIEGYINVDIRPVTDVCMDMREYVKTVSDNSVERVLMSHSLEHIPKADAQALLLECYRIIEPDGILEVICPDTKWTMVKYLSGEIDWEKLQTWMHACWRDESDRHLWVSDDTVLLPMIKDAGFQISAVYTGDGNIAVHAQKN